MHIVSHFDMEHGLRRYVMNEAFGKSTAGQSVLGRQIFKYESDMDTLKLIMAVDGVESVRSELRDITLTGIDTVVIRIDDATTWDDVEPELHRVLCGLEPVS